MGVPILEVGYTSATTARGDHEVHKGHVVALEKKKKQSSQANRRTSVGNATGLRNEQPKNRGSITGEGRVILFASHSVTF
jgi:hypothetical protein